MFGIWVFTSQGARGSLVMKCGSSTEGGGMHHSGPGQGWTRRREGGHSGLPTDNSRALKHHPAVAPQGSFYARFSLCGRWAWGRPDFT